MLGCRTYSLTVILEGRPNYDVVLGESVAGLILRQTPHASGQRFVKTLERFDFLI